MSNVSKPNLIAVLCSDIHLTLQSPVCRADEDWREVQAGYLNQLQDLAGSLPVICAGDIFDRWNASPELINFALEYLPNRMICVPGQHDLPNHRRDLMHRSGYGVLVAAGKIQDISQAAAVSVEGLVSYGFGWEEEIEPMPNEPQRLGAVKAIIHVAVIHRYMWTAGAKWPGAPEEAQLSAFKKQLRGYDVAVVGDNHIHFSAMAGNCLVFNCGGFIRRKSDEIDRKPCVGLLYSDGFIETRYLDVSADKFHEKAEDRKETPVNMKAFIDSLEGLGEQGVDFRAAVQHHLQNKDLKKSVRRMIEEIMETAV